MADKVLIITMTPMQVLCAAEACDRFFPNAKRTLVNASPITGTEKVMASCIQLYQWDRVITFYNRDLKVFTRLSNIAKQILAYWTTFFKLKVSSYDAVVFGHYLDPLQRYFASKFQGKPVVLVDDGIFSFQIPSFRKMEVEGNYPVTYTSKLNKAILKLIWGRQDLGSINMKLFSIYGIDAIANGESILNTMEGLQQMIADQKRDGLDYFIGSNLSEIGLLSEEHYLAILKKWSAQLSYAERPIYLAKFSEDKRKLNLIQSMGFELVEPNVPVELYFILNQLGIRTIASVFSSALLNLHLFNNQKVDTLFQYFFLAKDQVSSNHHKFVDSIYKNYRKYKQENFQELSL